MNTVSASKPEFPLLSGVMCIGNGDDGTMNESALVAQSLIMRHAQEIAECFPSLVGKHGVATCDDLAKRVKKAVIDFTCLAHSICGGYSGYSAGALIYLNVLSNTLLSQPPIHLGNLGVTGAIGLYQEPSQRLQV